MGLLTGKVALVTGAGSGIGRAVAIAYAREGAKVVAADVDEPGGQQTVSTIAGNGGTSKFVKADVSSPEDNRILVSETVSLYGALNIVCNNAGIAGPVAVTDEYPLDGWNRVISVNLSGVFYGMHFQIPAMLKTGGGAIVNMASILGAVGTTNSPAYVAAKHGLVGLTKAAALEYALQNIRINSVGPGYISTPLLSNNLSAEMLRTVESLHPMKRLGKAEEVAELVLFLSSEQSSFITGSYYPVDGGYLAQ